MNIIPIKGIRTVNLWRESVLLQRCYSKKRFIALKDRSNPNSSRFKLSKSSNLTSKLNKSQASRTKQSMKKNKVSTKTDIFKYGEFGGLMRRPNGNRDNMEKNVNLVKKITDFESLKLLPETRDIITKVISKESISINSLDGVKNAKIIPSPIQTLTVKKLAKDLMNPKLQIHTIAANTGSGKTMAYLLPLIDYLLRQRIEKVETWDSIKDKAIIQSVVLVPTYELVQQVYDTIKSLEEYVDLHTYKWDNSTQYPKLLESIKSRIDILVTTPNKLMTLFDIRMISRPERMLSQVKFAIIDEADTLMDQSWLELTHRSIRQFKNLNHLIFCSATIPNEFNKTIQRLFPTAETITTPRLHKISKILDFKMIDAYMNPFKGSKIKALAQILYAISQDDTEPGLQKRCIIFVNEKKTVQNVVEKMKMEYNHDCIGLSSDNSIEERLELIKDFVRPPVKTNESSRCEIVDKPVMERVPSSNVTIPVGGGRSGKKKSASKNVSRLKVLICTDMLARGLNFQGVRNVVLYDVPRTSIDLVHRVGRTARMHQQGRVFMIVDKKTKSWAKAIPKIIKKNVALS